MSALEERRRSAREAARVSADVVQSWALGAIEVGIESATRVEITAEFVTAMLTEVDRVGVQHGGIEAGLAAAFRAAGFEVVP